MRQIVPTVSLAGNGPRFVTVFEIRWAYPYSSFAIGSARPTVTTKALPTIDVVSQVLAGYAERRVFHGFSRARTAGDTASFQIAWHRGRVFELTFDAKTCTLRLPEVLTNVPAGAAMHAELKAFIRSRQSAELPEHRRIDRRKVQIRTYNRNDDILLVMKATDGDGEYAARKLVHLVNEIYLIFLADGSYFDYLVETFDLDPDHM
jgi:hypothetical protein